MLRVHARALAPMVPRAFSRSSGSRLMSGGGNAVSFDGEEKARVFKSVFEEGAPMWATMSQIASEVKPEAKRILDLGCGPGEPACHFAAKYSGATMVATDIAQSMVDLAKQRVASKGLTNVECRRLDMEDQSDIADASVDLVVAQMSFMFVPDKPKALAETFRVLKPGGVLIANVWNEFDLVDMAGAIMARVTGGGGGGKGPPPPPNPMGPLSLSDAALFDGMLREAGFEETAVHNSTDTVRVSLGPAGADQAFKLAVLPIWDKLDEFEAEGTFPGAWASAKAAFPEVSAHLTDAGGVINAVGSYRIAVVRKP